jgi:two-component system alkaline phosphatase synthesis response regulator PhoP
MSNKVRILLVEDEPSLIVTLSDMLKNEGYEVECIVDGIAANERIVKDAWDLILLDVILPGMTGFEICRNIRQRGISTPVLILTARGQTSDKVEGLKIGADDYLPKPFEPAELLARIHALLRRSAVNTRTASNWFTFGLISVDLAHSRVFRGSERILLSDREFALLHYLIDHRGSPVSRERLLLDVWGYNAAISTRTIDVHIALLRQKLEADPKNPEFILTVHMQGYRFVG